MLRCVCFFFNLLLFFSELTGYGGLIHLLITFSRSEQHNFFSASLSFLSCRGLECAALQVCFFFFSKITIAVPAGPRVKLLDEVTVRRRSNAAAADMKGRGILFWILPRWCHTSAAFCSVSHHNRSPTGLGNCSRLLTSVITQRGGKRTVHFERVERHENRLAASAVNCCQSAERVCVCVCSGGGVWGRGI